MATAIDQPRPAPRPVRRGKWVRRAVLLALLVAGAALAFFWRPLHARVETGVAYGARVACSCRFVAGRPLGDCRSDFAAGMGPVLLSEDAAARSVTAYVPLIASQTAAMRDGSGCVLEPWTN